MTNRAIFTIGLVVFLGGGVLLALGGTTGAAVGSTAGLAGLGLMGWSWLRARSA